VIFKSKNKEHACMRVSILVGAHNEGDRLWRTVESILETVGKLDAELIVGDDGSTDHSVREVRKHFPQILVVQQKKRMGVAAARGLAAGRARGEVLIFLDGHTKPEPGALERLSASVEKTHGEAVITPQIVGLDEATWRSQPQQIGNGYALDLETFDSWWLPLKKMKEVKEGRQIFYESPALIGCALAVSRELYDRVWGFDQHMQQWGSEDVDFALKAWTMGARVLHDPGATVAHRFQRYFEDYEVSAEYPLANQIRMARKHFTQSVWEDWLVRAQEQQRRRLKDRPEGLWASAWEVFQRNRASAEHERAYLLSRRERDEFWYAKRFERSWPTMGGPNLLAQPAIPPHVLFARPEASPAPPVITEIDPPQGGLIGTTVPITIMGKNFNNATIEPLPSGFSAAIESQTAEEIDATLTIPSSASGGNIPIYVTNQGGAKSNAWNFYVQIPSDLDIVFDSTKQVKDGTIISPSGEVLATNADGAYRNWTASLYDQNDPAGVIYASFTFTESFSDYSSTIPGSTEPTTKSVSVNTAQQPIGDTQAVFKTYPAQVGKGVMKYTQSFTVTVGGNNYPLDTSISWTLNSPGGGGAITIEGVTS
jgi:GT2 family glycosyltransferase